MSPELQRWAGPHLAQVEAGLAAAFVGVEPEAFRAALVYPLQTGGKRIRPLLCLAAAEAVSGTANGAVPAACALELLHTYSLVHDDLPARDDDAERRGRPTVHVVFGDATAILVGDALLTEAFAMVADAPALVRELAAAGGASGMVGGQYLDIHGVAGSMSELTRLHRLKTGALIRAAVRMGGLAAGADADALAALTRYGEAVGLAFQVADDVLDAEQDAGPEGPPSYLRFLGRAGAIAEAARLRDEALAAVAGLVGAGPLCLLARFAVERTV